MELGVVLVKSAGWSWVGSWGFVGIRVLAVGGGGVLNPAAQLTLLGSLCESREVVGV